MERSQRVQDVRPLTAVRVEMQRPFQIGQRLVPLALVNVEPPAIFEQRDHLAIAWIKALLGLAVVGDRMQLVADLIELAQATEEGRLGFRRRRTLHGGTAGADGGVVVAQGGTDIAQLRLDALPLRRLELLHGECFEFGAQFGQLQIAGNALHVVEQQAGCLRPTTGKAQVAHSREDRRLGVEETRGAMVANLHLRGRLALVDIFAQRWRHPEAVVVVAGEEQAIGDEIGERRLGVGQVLGLGQRQQQRAREDAVESRGNAQQRAGLAVARQRRTGGAQRALSQIDVGGARAHLPPQDVGRGPDRTVALVKEGVRRRDAGQGDEGLCEAAAFDKGVGVEWLDIAMAEDGVAPPRRFAPRRVIPGPLRAERVVRRRRRQLLDGPAQHELQAAPAIGCCWRQVVKHQSRLDEGRRRQGRAREAEDTPESFVGIIDQEGEVAVAQLQKALFWRCCHVVDHLSGRCRCIVCLTNG